MHPSSNGHPSSPDGLKEVQQELQADAALASEGTSSSDTKTNGGVDCTVIQDIGIAYNRKLKEAGIKTFEAFAALSAQEIVTITGTTLKRVEENRWLEQAAELAAGAKAESEKQAQE